MSTEINKAFVQQFSNNLIHLAQQRGSRLANTVRKDTIKGKYAHFDRLGKTSAVKRTSRHGDTPLIDSAHSRRRVSIDDYEWADLIDRQDEVRLLIDPRSSYAESGAWALGRILDDIIRDAALGNSVSIDASDSSSNIALPASQKVDEDFGVANSNLTIEKLIEAKRIMAANDVMMDDPMTFVYNASAQSSLMNETEIQSADYNTIRALVRGEINTFLGFDFILYNRIQGTLSNDIDPFKCFCYAKSGIGLAMGQDINVRISERSDKSYSTQVYASMTAGAVRIEEEKVVEVQCYQTS